MLKIYTWRGATWQFEEGSQPADAVELSEAVIGKTAEKAQEPKNKARETKKK